MIPGPSPAEYLACIAVTAGWGCPGIIPILKHGWLHHRWLSSCPWASPVSGQWL